MTAVEYISVGIFPTAVPSSSHLLKFRLTCFIFLGQLVVGCSHLGYSHLAFRCIHTWFLYVTIRWQGSSTGETFIYRDVFVLFIGNYLSAIGLKPRALPIVGWIVSQIHLCNELHDKHLQPQLAVNRRC